MEIGALGPDREEPRPATHRPRPGRRPSARPGPPPRFYLATTGCFVSDEEVRTDEILVQLLAEDLAWCADVDDWHRRRPAWWRTRRLRAWRAEYARLAQDRSRIALTAQFYGVPD